MATKEEKKQIKEHNKVMKEYRKTELPPVYEPLELNCDLLFALADKMNLSSKEKKETDLILRGKNNSEVFLSKLLDSKYRFDAEKDATAGLKVIFTGDDLIVPATCLTDNYSIVVKVTNSEKEYSDWIVKKVDRNKSKKIDNFVVTLNSKSIAKQDWEKDSKVKVEIYDGISKEPLATFSFKVSKYRDFKIKKIIEFEQVK